MLCCKGWIHFKSSKISWLLYKPGNVSDIHSESTDDLHSDNTPDIHSRNTDDMHSDKAAEIHSGNTNHLHWRNTHHVHIEKYVFFPLQLYCKNCCVVPSRWAVWHQQLCHNQNHAHWSHWKWGRSYQRVVGRWKETGGSWINPRGHRKQQYKPQLCCTDLVVPSLWFSVLEHALTSHELSPWWYHV